MTTISAPALLRDLPQRTVAEPMDEGILEQLQQHLQLEYLSSYHYWELAGRFAARELRGFARYLQKESEAEQSHAAEVVDYISDRGQQFRLGTMEPFRGDCPSVASVFEVIFGMERDVTSSLQQIHAMAEEAGDTRTAVFLEPIIERQIASEGEAAHLLSRIRIADGNAAALLILDNELREGHHSPHRMADDD
jgi:ferritin